MGYGKLHTLRTTDPQDTRKKPVLTAAWRWRTLVVSRLRPRQRAARLCPFSPTLAWNESKPRLCGAWCVVRGAIFYHETGRTLHSTLLGCRERYSGPAAVEECRESTAAYTRPAT